MAEITKAAIARELLAREKAKTGFLDFVEYTFPQYKAARHHRLIAEKLEAVEGGDIKRLMLFLPPRSGKSQLASRHFPAWYLGRHPDRQIICASANADLAADFGRDVRNLIADPEYKHVFKGVDLAPDSKAAGKWHTNTGGSYFAAGVGGMISGRGSHLLVIDDPVAGREEADSQIERDRLSRWYSSQAFMRLMPDASIILIMTRYHDDDLAGRLIKGAEEWEILKLRGYIETQAQADEDLFDRQVGESLWPEWFTPEALLNQKAVVTPRDWASMIQQDPISEEGAYFKSEWIQYYDEVPEPLTRLGASDYAVSGGKGDWTVHGVGGVDSNEDFYLIDWWRGREESDVWVEVFLDLMDKHQTLNWGEESGQIIKSLGPFIERRMEERAVYGQREQFASTKDKGTRARAIQGLFAMKKVYLPRNASWTQELVNELLLFTGNNDREDDQVDVLSLFGRMIRDMRGTVLSLPEQHQEVNHGSKVIDLLEKTKNRRRYA
jgi:predicted phage terminase large subunit-like protein